MPISIYAGGTGSGKSYGVMENVVLPALKEGRHILTNLALRLDVIKQDYPDHRIEVVPVEEMEKPGYFNNIPGGALFILDEAWRLWPSGQKMTAIPDDQLEFLRMHRHRVGPDGRTCEIVVISQAVADISTAVRRVADFTYKATKLEAVGMSKTYRIDIYNKAPTGDNIPDNQRIRQLFGNYKPEIYKYYKSHTESVTGTAGNESRSDNRANAFKSALIKYGIPASILMMVGGIYYTIQFFKPKNHVKPQQLQQQPVPTTQPAVYAQPQQPSPVAQPVSYIPAESVISTPRIEDEQESIRKRESKKWRVAGFLIRPDKKSGKVSLQSPWSFRTIPFEDFCIFLPGDVDIQCEIEGEIVTAWTGHQLGGTISLPARVQRDTKLTDANTSTPAPANLVSQIE